MSRHFRILASLVGLLYGFCVSQAAPAQSMSLVWKRWNWSILYPVDQASSIATRALLISLGPGGRLPSEHHESGKLCGGLAASRVGSSVAGDLWLNELVCEIPSKTTKLGRFVLDASDKLGAVWGSVESEFAEASERVECLAAARMEAESRQRELEYWGYYEDCDRWMPGFWMTGVDSRADENLQAIRATLLEDSVMLGLRCVVAKIRGFMVEAGENTAFAAERAALAGLQLAGSPMERVNPIKLAALESTAAIGRFASHVTIDVGNGCRQLFSRTQSVLAVIPIEAIGFVLPD